MGNITQFVTADSETTVEMYVRSLCPAGARDRQEQILDRLEQLDRRDHIDGFSVSVWGARIPHDGWTPVGEHVRERLDAFEAWSDLAGTDLSSVIERRESGSLVAEERSSAIVLPMVCMAEYHGDELQYVSPCVDDGTVCTVLDRLDEIGGDLDGNEQ